MIPEWSDIDGLNASEQVLYRQNWNLLREASEMLGQNDEEMLAEILAEMSAIEARIRGNHESARYDLGHRPGARHR